MAFTVETGTWGSNLSGCSLLRSVISSFSIAHCAACCPATLSRSARHLKATQAVPGFLRLQVKSRTKGLEVEANKGQGAPFVWGVAYEPERITPGAARPADFDAFWADAVKTLDATVPVDARLEEIPAKSNAQRTYYRVSFASAGGRRVWGWLSMPKGKGPFPVEVSVPGAGIGATGSAIGAFRLARDVLAKQPDVVVVEFSVNDAPGRECAESYEGVIRQLLKDPRGIAVIQLGMVGQAGNNVQAWHGKVAAHYRVPYVSYRDALYYPYVKEGQVKWTDISPDTIHPNDDGHAYAAALLNWTIERRYAEWKRAGRPLAAVPPLPAPLYGTRYDKGRFCLMQDAKIVENKGFFPLRDTCWGIGLACTNAQGRLVFEVEGPTVALLYRCGNKPYNWGKIAVKIDGTPVVDGLDCFRDQWWWYTPALFLCRDRPGRHVVEVETKAEKNAKSAGFGCHLTGLLVSE